MSSGMERQFILRIEHEGRVSFQVVRGSREAMQLAETHTCQKSDRHVAVLDATGRVIWSSN